MMCLPKGKAAINTIQYNTICLHIDASCIFLDFPVVYALVVFNRCCLALQS